MSSHLVRLPVLTGLTKQKKHGYMAIWSGSGAKADLWGPTIRSTRRQRDYEITGLLCYISTNVVVNGKASPEVMGFLFDAYLLKIGISGSLILNTLEEIDTHIYPWRVVRLSSLNRSSNSSSSSH